MQTPIKRPEGEMTFLQQEIISLLRQGFDNANEIAKAVGCQPDWVRKTRRMYEAWVENPDIYQEMDRKDKVHGALQKARDSLRVERKQFREEVRYHNTTNTLYEEIAAELQNIETHAAFNTVEHEDHESETEGIFQISDIHFNELIDLPFNQFDFKIGAKRLKKFATKAKRMFKAHDVTTVHVPFTGDILNSDRRLDEVMNAATNRAKASVLSAMILKQVLIDLNQDFNIKTYMVTGNESRMHKEMGASEIRQTDNYDMIVHEMLKMMFMDKPGVEFIEGSPIEQPINVRGHNILLLHGHQIKMSQCASQIQRLKGKWSDYQNATIDYVLFGHFHTARVTDLFARSGGVCGANAYSDNQLQLSSRASQNMFLVNREGIDGIKVDLQHSDDYDGYNVDELLEAYNVTAVNRVAWMRPKKI